MNYPQQVTIRYVHDLLFAGSNHEFWVEEVTRHPNIVQAVVVGQYWTVRLASIEGTHSEPGATPTEACKRVLQHFGVTFK